jgi:hypothetical protein
MGVDRQASSVALDRQVGVLTGVCSASTARPWYSVGLGLGLLPGRAKPVFIAVYATAAQLEKKKNEHTHTK